MIKVLIKGEKTAEIIDTEHVMKEKWNNSVSPRVVNTLMWD